MNTVAVKMVGLKEAELRKLTTCASCGRKLGKIGGLPIFHVLTIERHILDLGAAVRQNGLAQVLGGRGDLAMLMGPNDDMTKPMMEPIKVMVCDPCSSGVVCLAHIVESASKDRDTKLSHAGDVDHGQEVQS